MSDRGWWLDAGQVSAAEIAAELGMEQTRGGGWGPCPACHADTRSRADRRGAVGLRRDGAGWECHACHLTGDGIDLVALAVLGVRGREVKGAGDGGRLRSWFSARGWARPEEGAAAADWKPPPKRPPAPIVRVPQDQLAALWAACGEPEADPDVVAFAGARALVLADLPDGLARALPRAYSWPEWWPAGWAASWRLVSLLREADGTPAGLQGRAVDGATPKTRNPLRTEVRELLLMNGSALRLARGVGTPIAILIVEGYTDWLRACSVAPVGLAVFGGFSGSWPALARIEWPEGVAVLAAPDGDPGGDRHWRAIQEALPAARRCRVPAGQDLDDIVRTEADLAGLMGDWIGADPDVARRCERSKEGRVRGTLENIIQILEADRRWRGRVRLNAFAGVVEIDGCPIRDEDEVAVYRWLSANYGVEVAVPRVSDALRYLAREHPYHPVQDYLSGLVWDGQPRAEGMLIDLFGATDTALTREIGRRWLISCVARIFEPGSKVDTVLILVGDQGLRKSTGLRTLAVRPGWFCDSAIDFRNKDAYQILPGTWIYELGELDSFRRSEASSIKAFLTAQEDRYRPSYGRNTVHVPRQTVFVGTTNEAEFLNDPTGSRRFWPIEVGQVDLDGIERDRDQIWAEAVAAYRAGVPWWLNAASDTQLREDSGRFRQVDAWEETIGRWVAGRVGEFTVGDVLDAALGVPPDRQTRVDSMRAATVLRSLGCTKGQRRRGPAGERVYPWTPPIPGGAP